MKNINREQLLNSIYKVNTNLSKQANLQSEILDAFMVILTNWQIKWEQPLVRKILELFNIRRSWLELKGLQQKYQFVKKKMLHQIETYFEKYFYDCKTMKYTLDGNELLCVDCKFRTKEQIFKSILEKEVHLFETQFNHTIRYCEKKQILKEDVVSRSRIKTFEQTTLVNHRNSRNTSKVPNMDKIRIYSQSSIKNKTSLSCKPLQCKKSSVILTFVKKFTPLSNKTGDLNEFKTTHDLKEAFSNYLFSQSRVLKSGLHSRAILNSFQLNISAKFIKVYQNFIHQLEMVSANFQNQLNFQNKTNKNQFIRSPHLFNKQVQIYKGICGQERMSLKLSPHILRWVELFVQNLKKKVEETKMKEFENKFKKSVFAKLNSSRIYSPHLLKPSRRKKETTIATKNDHGPLNDLLKATTMKKQSLIINKNNSARTQDQKSNFKLNSITSDLNVHIEKKTIILSTCRCLPKIIKIQAWWRGTVMKRIFSKRLERYRSKRDRDFIERIERLRWVYPAGAKLNIDCLRMRIKRKSMKTNNILNPYSRSAKQAVNFYTVFGQNRLSQKEMVEKSKKNSQRRMLDFRIMIENNLHHKIIQSGLVLTANQINMPIFSEGGNAIWWTVKNQNLKLTQILLEGGANPNSCNEKGDSCLHVCMKKNNVKIAFLLMDYGGNLNSKNEEKMTPLFYAKQEMLKAMGIQEGIISIPYEQSQIKDNNSLYFQPMQRDNFYPEHMY